jgi:hypothetical protein
LYHGKKKTAPVKESRFYLIPVVVVAFDDHHPVAAVPMHAAVVVTVLGACTAKFPMFTELAPIAVVVAADANANALSGGYGRCRNGDSRERGKR